MGKFKTPNLFVLPNCEGNYRTLHGRVDVIGRWPARPKGTRLFNEEEIRNIRRLHSIGRRHREIALLYDCSHVSIYYIVKRAIYSDIDDIIVRYVF